MHIHVHRKFELIPTKIGFLTNFQSCFPNTMYMYVCTMYNEFSLSLSFLSVLDVSLESEDDVKMLLLRKDVE